MYRRRKCCCYNNQASNYNNDMFETACNNTGCNCSDQYNNNCECGFDEEEDVFPTNPMLAQSYVPIQRMNKTFTPCI